MEKKITKTIAFRCTEKEMEKIKNLASDSSRSLSSMVSFIIKKYLSNVDEAKN